MKTKALVVAAIGMVFLSGGLASAQEGDEGLLVVEAQVVDAFGPIFGPADALERAARGELSGLIRDGGAGDLTSQLEAAQAKERLRILASPRFLTGFGEGVFAKSGVTFAVQVVAHETVTVQFKDAVVGVEITPSRGPGGRIELAYEINKDAPRYDLPSVEEPGIIQTTAIEGKAVARDGGTAIVVGPHEITQATFEPGHQLIVFITARRVTL